MALALDEIRGGSGAFAGLTGGRLKDRRAAAAGSARFDVLKLGAGVIECRNDASTTTSRSRLLYAGAPYAVTPAVTIDGEVFKLDYKDSANGALLVALCGTCSLSKHTAVHARVGHVANDGRLMLGVSNAAAGHAPVAGGSQNGLVVRVRHCSSSCCTLATHVIPSGVRPHEHSGSPSRHLINGHPAAVVRTGDALRPGRQLAAV